jgi:hypothetical protein
LHGGEQRQGEQRGPELAVAELRADLRVGRDARGVVVGGAADQAGAEEAEEAMQRFQDLVPPV